MYRSFANIRLLSSVAAQSTAIQAHSFKRPKLKQKIWKFKLFINSPKVIKSLKVFVNQIVVRARRAPKSRRVVRSNSPNKSDPHLEKRA